MTIKQLSVFIENKSGTLVKVLDLLKENGIQIIAMSIADTADYGICRIVCNETERAYVKMKEAGLAVSLCNVFAIQLDDEPGMAADAVAAFAQQNISITYIYSFRIAGKGILIFRTDNEEGAWKLIESKGLNYISEDKLVGLL